MILGEQLPSPYPAQPPLIVAIGYIPTLQGTIMCYIIYFKENYIANYAYIIPDGVDSAGVYVLDDKLKSINCSSSTH